MSPHFNVNQSCQEFTVALALTLLFDACWYLLGWVRFRLISPTIVPGWRAASFFLGLFLVWAACGSSLAAYDHNLLTVHMIKHLLLMTVAPALILLGEPARVFWIGMPLFAQCSLRGVLGSATLLRFARFATRPAVCWALSAMTLVLWHVPAVFALSMQSENLHMIEQIVFFAAGLFFWWPVVQPWPSPSNRPQWSIILYLFLATLPCDILSGFLVFSDRVEYPVYCSVPRMFGLSVLADQQCAAALMWTCVTVVYLLPAAIISMKLLAPRTSQQDNVARPHAGGEALQGDLQGLEVF